MVSMENETLDRIERIITNELVGKQLWGDLDLSLSEYEVLRGKFVQALSFTYSSVEKVANDFPVSFTTLLVFLTRYKFDSNFWGLLANELSTSISLPAESRIGEIARSTFIKYGFDFSDVQNERRVNLEPILYEAGRPPESCLDDLFYVLSYDTHDIFDPQLIIEDLTEMRSYQIRKPMRNFFRRFKDRASEFVMEVREAMLCVDQGMSGDSTYIANYTEWKAQERSREAIQNRKKQDFQTKPYLTFDNSRRGLCMVLPRVLIKDEWIAEVAWNINNGAIIKELEVFGDEGRRYIDSLIVPISPAASYQVDLIDNESLTESSILQRPWHIQGIPDDGFIMFNAGGRLIAPNYLPLPFGTMVRNDSFSFTASEELLVTRQFYPTDVTGYSTLLLNPSGQNAVLSSPILDNPIRARRQVEMVFSGKTLLNTECGNGHDLFTDVPSLTIRTDANAALDGLTIRIGKESFPITDYFDCGSASLNLSNLAPNVFSKFGTYSVRLYQHGNFIKHAEFTLVPFVSSDYYPLLEWPDLHRPLRYTFKKQADVQLEFLNCPVISTEKEYIVDCPVGIGAITARMDYSSANSAFSCGFELPVRPFEYGFSDSSGATLDSNGHIARVGVSEVIDNGLWVNVRFFGQYKDTNYCIKLRNANGIEQEETLQLNQVGSGNLNLGVFSDTLQTRPLPARLELWRICSEDCLPLITVTDQLQFSSRPRYRQDGFIVISADDGKRDLEVRRFLRPQVQMTLNKSGLSSDKKYRGYKCPKPLTQGLYIVESTVHREEQFFEDEGPSTDLSNSTNTMYVSDRDKKAPIMSFSDWLDQLIRDIISSDMDDIVRRPSFCKLESLRDYKDCSLSDFDIERMIAVAYFAKAKCSNAKKQSMFKCMDAVSVNILDPYTRLKIVNFLVDHHCDPEVFDICIMHYHLLLISSLSEDMVSLAEKVEEYSTELSLLLRMHSGDLLSNTLKRKKYHDLIGKDAIRSMLSVYWTDDPVIIATEQRAFLSEKPSKVTVTLSPDISGEMEPIQKQMIRVTYNSVFFDKSAKPDSGIYFAGIRYVDQYVDWYMAHSDKECNIKDETKEAIVAVISEYCDSIVQFFNQLMRSTDLKPIMYQYESALSARYSDDPLKDKKACIPARYFYIQGLAAFLATLPSEYHKYGWAVRTGTAFMVKALEIAPRIARRDILMASTYSYLISKEKKLCR